MHIAIVTVSDRASRGEYEDLSGPAIEAWLKKVIVSPYKVTRKVIPDGFESVRDTLIDLCDQDRADLVLTTGGTGPSPRDETPEAMRAVLIKEMLGFGELMRRASLEQTLIVNLPGKPVAIDISLAAVFPAIPYCLDLIRNGRVETKPLTVANCRPAN